MRKFDYATIKRKLKNEHLSLEAFADLHQMSPDDFEKELRKRLGENTANPLIREMKGNKRNQDHSEVTVEEIVVGIAETKTEDVKIESTEPVCQIEEEVSETILEVTQAEVKLEVEVETEETEPETLEKLQGQVVESRELLFSLESDIKQYNNTNVEICGRIESAKNRFQKIYDALIEEKSIIENLMVQLESNQEQISVAGNLIKQVKADIRLLEDKISAMSYIKVTCGEDLQMEGAVSEKDFEMSTESIKAKLLSICDEPFVANLTLQNAMCVAKYLVLTELVKGFCGREAELYFAVSEAEETVISVLTEQFGLKIKTLK